MKCQYRPLKGNKRHRSKTSDNRALELARALEEIARKIAELSKTLAYPSSRKTIKAKDVKQAVRDLFSSSNY